MEIKDIESVFMASPVARTNWASHVIMLNSSLPLGVSYWYMKQSVEMGWSSNALKIQIETNLYSRQISNNKVNNFTTTLPAPQSDLANYLLKDPYIFDLAGTKEKADERAHLYMLISNAYIAKRNNDSSLFYILKATDLINTTTLITTKIKILNSVAVQYQQMEL